LEDSTESALEMADLRCTNQNATHDFVVGTQECEWSMNNLHDRENDSEYSEKYGDDQPMTCDYSRQCSNH
jgi:hypothetical protein